MGIVEGRNCQDYKGSDGMRGTHLLEATEGGVRTWGRKWLSEGHPSFGDGQGGHSKCFGMGILEIIKTSQGIISETRSCSLNEVGVLGVFENMLERAFHCGCR